MGCVYLLTDLKKGDKGMVSGFNSEDLPVKIYEMGLLPGTSVEMNAKTSDDKTCYITYGKEDSKMALRKSESDCVMVEINEEDKQEG